jgi:DNA-directed RNA polymerase specialized sigma24 family protein
MGAPDIIPERLEQIRGWAKEYARRTKKARAQDCEDFAAYCVEVALRIGARPQLEIAWADWQRELYGRIDRHASARAKRAAMLDWKQITRSEKDDLVTEPADVLDAALKGQAAFLQLLEDFNVAGEDRGVMVLVYLFDMTPAEVAFVMGRSKGTIDQRLFHLRRAMRLVDLEP